MKKALLLSAVSCLAFGSMSAQIEDGTVLDQNIIITDLDGTEHDIFAYLDAGKTVVLDLYAEWCAPCWNYHNADSGHPAGGALKDLHNTYGPDGTDEVVVIGIESDGSTPVTAIDGGAGSTYGWNWLDGVPYPMANDDVVAGIFQQGYYPYIIRICPNRQIFELGQQNAEGIMTDVGTCFAPAGVNNPAVLNYTGDVTTCGDATISVQIQNLGSDNLTAVSFEVTEGSNTLLSYDWTGDLAPFETEMVELGVATLTQTTDVMVSVTSSDDDPSNNSVEQTVNFAVESTNVVTVTIELDSYPEETTWELSDNSGNVLASGGPYNGQGGQTITSENILPALGCYNFTIMDSYGDGLNGAAWTGGYDGTYLVMSSDGTEIASGGGSTQFVDEGAPFNATSDASAIEDVLVVESFNLFPNPTVGNLNVELELISAEKVTIDVYDMVGKVVFSVDYGTMGSGYALKQLDVSNLNSGIYMMDVNIGENSIVSKFVLKN